jgi:precorrin-6B methylase 2
MEEAAVVAASFQEHSVHLGKANQVKGVMEELMLVVQVVAVVVVVRVWLASMQELLEAMADQDVSSEFQEMICITQEGVAVVSMEPEVMEA